MNTSIFDETFNKLITEAIGLNEAPIAGIGDIGSFEPSSSQATYSITDVTGDDDEKIKEVIVKTGEYILDYLSEPSPLSRKEFQDKVAEFIRKSINDIFPDSKKASGGKAYMARDYYAARAVMKAFEDQGVIDTKADLSKIQKGDVEEDELPQVASDIVDDMSSEVEDKVQDDLDDTKEKSEEIEDSDIEDIETPQDSEEVEIKTTAELEKPEAEKEFNNFFTYDIEDVEGLNLTDDESNALEYLEPESTGKEMRNKLESSLKFRDRRGEIIPILNSLIAKGVLSRTEGEETKDSGESDYESEEDFLNKFGFKADPYTGSIDT